MSDTFATNMERATKYLERFKKNTIGHYINGEFTLGNGGREYDNLTPTDNSVIGKVMAGSVADMDAACEAAENAFEAWTNLSGAERKKLLHKFADRLVERADEIALVESMDCGQPIRFMKQAALRGAANFRFFADKAPEARDGKSSHQEEHTNITIRNAIGPVGIITPWNTPFMLSTWKIAPA